MNKQEQMSNQKKSQNQRKKRAKKQRLLTFGNYIAILFLIASILSVSGAAYVINYIVKTTDTNHLLSKMENVEPTTFLDTNDSEFAELGMESRENITYDQVPQVVIDAFLAIEDSRFYKHNGFDLPRFISSAITNLKSGTLAQGGSTLTMQTIDNFIMKPEEDKMASENKYFSTKEKIERKMKEIYMSIYIEKKISKEQIIEKYLNQINFGDSARGIQRGAQYFFGKNVDALNLSEAAYLAGCINAPYINNPYNGYSTYIGQDENTKFNFYEAATKRRNDTLDMMQYHGFITEKECELAKSTQLAFLLAGKKHFNDEPFKNYKQAASQEVLELTGLDPATTPMIIHTYLDPKAQEAADAIADGKIVNLNTNKNYQIATTILDNKTGGVVAFIPGRSDYKEKFYRNRADAVERMSGSTIKPLLDYAFALDRLGYCTGRVYNDKKIIVDGTPIQNSDGKYYGKVSMEEAIARSLNPPAIQTLQDALKRGMQPDVIKYMKNLGFDEKELENFNVRYSIGGSFSTSPKQMAGAFAVLANKGVHKTPRYVKKIEFKNSDKKPIIVTTNDVFVMSEQAAYMTSDLLYRAVHGKYRGWNLMGMINWGSLPIYGKTGTSDWWTDGLHLGIPQTAPKDEWMINYTNEYTIATWSGFDQDVADGNNYVNSQLLYENIPGYINLYLFKTLSKQPQKITAPATGLSHYGGGLIKSEFLASAAKNNPMTLENTKDYMDDLSKLFDKVKDKLSKDYTSESYSAFKKVLDLAKKMIDSDELIEDDEIKKMIEDLKRADENLKSNVNKDSLYKMINHAASYNEYKDNYTTNSFVNLANVVEAARAVYRNPSATQAQVDSAVSSIQQAIANLQEVNNHGSHHDSDYD